MKNIFGDIEVNKDLILFKLSELNGQNDSVWKRWLIRVIHHSNSSFLGIWKTEFLDTFQLNINTE